MLRFSDPIVLLERFDVEALSLKLDQKKENNICSETLDDLVRKGNEMLGYKDPHTCYFCRKTLKARYRLKLHIQAVHLRSVKFFCDLCPKICFHKQDVKGHMKKIHSEKNISCQFCNYKTNSVYNYKKHKLTHGEGVECPICKKRVTLLKSHYKDAHGQKVKCPVCQMVIVKKHLKLHMSKHIEKPHKCEKCDEVFDCHKYLRW